MLIDIVFVDEWLVGVVGEQVFGETYDDLLWMDADLESFQGFCCLGAPSGKVGIHVGDEGGKLRVFVDGGFDGALFHGKIESGSTAILAALRAGSPRSGIKPILGTLNKPRLDGIFLYVVQRCFEVLRVTNVAIEIIRHPKRA